MPRFVLHYGDMTDATNLIRIVQETQPDEIYNLAAQSHVQVSLRDAGIHRQRRRARHAAPARGDPAAQARREDAASTRPRPRNSTARVQAVPQNETTPFYPRSPYAAAKLYAYWITVNYREAYGMHASNGILFNHESPIARRDVRHAQDHARGRARSISGCRKGSISAISTPSATGAMRAIMSAACG